jgi:hypothetical protein
MKIVKLIVNILFISGLVMMASCKKDFLDVWMRSLLLQEMQTFLRPMKVLFNLLQAPITRSLIFHLLPSGLFAPRTMV